MNKKNYRAEIDGLRALAVLSVIFYHYDLHYFRGGFLGVDIFFVISGYLISNLILFELNSDNFSILSFFERRIRRIIPALYFVILITIPISWFFLSSGLLWDFWQSVIASTLFLSNFLFTLETNYFDISTKYKPLIHTWSLSIEEQFYIFFPIILIFFHKKINFLYFIYFFLILFSIYVFITNYQIPFETKFQTINRINSIGLGSFFFSLGRIWELLFGCLISLYLFKNKIQSSNIISILSFLIMLYCIILFDEQNLSREIFTLMIIVSTSLLIIFISKNNFIGKILVNKFLVFIGLISYSLYLVHQPVISFLNIYFLKLNFYIIISSLFVIVLISILSYFLVEKPFRNKKNFNTKKIFVLFFLTTIFLIIIPLIGLQNNNINLHSEFLTKNINQEYKSLVLNMKTEGNRANKKIREIGNVLNKNLNINKIIFLGDSQSWDWIRSLYMTNLFNNYKFDVIDSKLKCYKFLTKLNIKNNCSLFINKLNSSLQSKNISLIIINHNYQSFKDLKFIDNLLLFLKKFNQKTIVVGNAKFLDVTLLSLKIAKKMSKDNNYNNADITKNIKIQNSVKINEELKLIAKKYGFTYLSEYDFFCISNNCEIFSNSYAPYIYDDMHYTFEGEKVVGKKIYEYIYSLNILPN